MFKDENRHYSLRKLSVGLASVLIGISFASGNNHTVKADTVKDDSNGVQTVVQTTATGSNAVVKSHDTVIKVDAKDGANVAAKANAESTPEEQSQTPEAVKKDFGTITQDIRQKAIKASEAAIKVQNNTVKDNSDETTLNAKGGKAVAESMPKEDKTEAKENQGWTDSAENKPQMSTLGPTTNKKLNATNDTNGGNVTTQAIRVINFVYPDGYTGKKQDSITQTVDVPQKAKENPDPVYFEDYTVPEIKGLLEPDKTVISKQQADINKPINVTVTYKLVESNTNDAFALDSKNGLHEHANVNDNGGYDADYWGKINVDDWNYTTNGNTITISGYKGTNPASVIIPNGADFGFIDGNIVEINKYVILQLTRTATRIGISKTANNKVAVNTTDLSQVFSNKPNLMQMDLHNLDTSKVTDMSHMFANASSLTTIGDLSKWDTSNVTNMNSMFSDASSLIDLGDLNNWDTSKVTDMSYMFGVLYRNASSLTNIGDLSKWDTSNVTNMNHMFSGASSLIDLGDLNNWDTSKVTDMSSMFYDTSSLIDLGDLSKWDTSKVTDMSYMFSVFGKASSLTNIGDLSKWNTSKVTNMSFMFANASSLTNIGDLSKWDTSNVTDMSHMFESASRLTNIGDLSKWDTSNVTNMRSMFANASSLIDLGDLSKWDTSKVTDMSQMFDDTSSLTNIGDLSKWNTSKVTNMSAMFANASSLTNIGELNNWDTSKVTNMSHMFANASSLTNIGELNNWDTSKVTNMSYMFSDASSLIDLGDLSKWNTSKVTDMSYMFSVLYGKVSSLTNIGDLSKWDTSKVTNMSFMFANASSLTNIGELNNWDTSKVTNMRSMFANASSLIDLGDLSKWNTSKVTNMSYMFSSAEALRYLNISNWDLTKLANKNAMNAMFHLDTDLTVIANNVKLPTWYQTKITDAKYVWSNNMAVITNVPELIESTGAVDNLKIDDQDASRSIFYDSKGSSDAVQVLKDANQAYINKYEQDHPKYLLALDASVDQTDPIALANAKFTLSHKLIDVVQTDNATRTIIVHLPNGTTQTIVQTIGLKRNAQKDLVTEIISSTAPWELDAANSSFTINGVEQTQTAYKQNSNIITFSSITLPKVPGYKANVTRNNGLLMVSYLALAPEKPETNNNLNDLQFSNKLATNSTVQFNSTVESNIVVKSDMYQVVNEDHNWQLPVIKNYDLKFATNKNQIIFAYTKDKQYNYHFVLTFKDGQYRLATFDKQGTLLKTYSIKSYKKLAKIIHFLVSMNIA